MLSLTVSTIRHLVWSQFGLSIRRLRDCCFIEVLLADCSVTTFRIKSPAQLYDR